MTVLDLPLLCGPTRTRTRSAVPAALRGATTATALVGGWVGAVALARHVHPSTAWRDVALFAHLAALVIGLGPVIVIDWLGMLWALGRRTLAEVTRTAAAVHGLIWVGFTGLVGSGTLLEPNTGAALTRVKLGLVLVLAVNGLHAHTLQPRLRAEWDAVPPDLLARAAATAVVSQLGWWTAVAIGYLNARR
jgi:hypothetical protein